MPAEAIFGLVVGAIELAKTTRDGIAAVRKQFLDEGRFWRGVRTEALRVRKRCSRGFPAKASLRRIADSREAAGRS
jgi:hypothetical protein